MSLAELLISSLLLVSSSSAAVGAWSRATVIWQQSNQLEEQADELALVQLASHRWLKLQGSKRSLLRSDSHPCLLDVRALAAASDQALPLPQGITRQWVVDSDQLGIWQELSVLDGDAELLLQRRQLFSPAAYGLCRS